MKITLKFVIEIYNSTTSFEKAKLQWDTEILAT